MVQTSRILKLSLTALIRQIPYTFSNNNINSIYVRTNHILSNNMDKYVTKTSRSKTKTESRPTDTTDAGNKKTSPASPPPDPPNRSYVTRTVYKGSVIDDKAKFLKMPLEEKRNIYKCGKRYMMVENVPTWPEYYESKSSKLSSLITGSKIRLKIKDFQANEEINNKVSIWKGDITTLEIDAITNAANNSLMGGGGVDGAIHNAAGQKLVAECVTLNGCDTGKAKITGGYKLPAKYVIHTVGPIGEKPSVLEECYTNVLNLLLENDLRTVALPCISTGIYGYPNDRAAKIALSVVRDFLEKKEVSDKIDRIIFCLFMPVDVKLYEEYMQVFFPIPDLYFAPEEKENKDKKKSEEKEDKMETDDNSEKKNKAAAGPKSSANNIEMMDISNDKNIKKDTEPESKMDTSIEKSNVKVVETDTESKSEDVTNSKSETVNLELSNSKKEKSESQEAMQTETSGGGEGKSDSEVQKQIAGPVTRRSLKQAEETEPSPKKAMATKL